MNATTIPRSTRQAAAKPAHGALIARSRVEWASKPWLGPALYLAGYFAALVGMIGGTAWVL
jgi:hypothetical protein